MIPNPILKVLSTLSSHEVRHLLMGGQACVFYGAAEFSRDCDIAVLADEQNLARLRTALEELQAECIAVPPFEPKYLERGQELLKEEEKERAADETYWQPLKRELEALRRAKRTRKQE